MRFIETELPGAYVIELEPHRDGRGFFARSYCRRDFQAHGLEPCIAQCNVAYNAARGTVRGLHFQYPPYAETKVVRATKGAVLDVIVDLRPESATFLKHITVELSADNQRALYVPRRFAHGYQTLEDGTVTGYQVGEFYESGAEGGLSPFDEKLGIAWPFPVGAISDKDGRWPALAEQLEVLVQRMAARERTL